MCLCHLKCILHRYMKRRCVFLDNLPAFNYNTGCGEYKGKTRQSVTDTRHLGSTLMETMLKEVSDFCDPAIKEGWSQRPHQQVSISLFVFAGIFCISQRCHLNMYLEREA